jgi:hypothetical protein
LLLLVDAICHAAIASSPLPATNKAWPLCPPGASQSEASHGARSLVQYTSHLVRLDAMADGCCLSSHMKLLRADFYQFFFCEFLWNLDIATIFPPASSH